MKHRRLALCLAVVVAAATRELAADARCLGYDPARIVFCDDFDQYCNGNDPDHPWSGYPTVPDYGCPDDATDPNQNLFNQGWIDQCAYGLKMQVDRPDPLAGQVYNLPFALRYRGSTAASIAQRHSFDLTSVIASRHPGMEAVNGTDEKPLVLRYWGWSGTGTYPNSPMYVELMLDDDPSQGPDGDWAPTDYVWFDCNASPPAKRYPIVCQQWLADYTMADCPELSSRVHASHCFGWLAQLDRNPCDNETGRKPTMYHAATFDGLKWYDLRLDVFPGYGDFLHYSGGAWFEMSVRTDSYVVRLESSGQGVSQATIPRQYLGPFNKIAIGTAPGCELDPITGECVGGPSARECWDYVYGEAIGWSATYLDTPVLYDGVYVALEGACCGVDGTCSVIGRSVCEAAGGHFQGYQTPCEGVQCCPLPFADTDHDGDVDQWDFSAWQLCYTGEGQGVPAGCDCFDRDSDVDVDAGDFAAFNACSTGPNVPWLQSQLPACVP